MPDLTPRHQPTTRRYLYERRETAGENPEQGGRTRRGTVRRKAAGPPDRSDRRRLGKPHGERTDEGS